MKPMFLETNANAEWNKLSMRVLANCVREVSNFLL